MILKADKKWQFATYHWQDNGTTEKLTGSLIVKGNQPSDLDFRIPSPTECTMCHNACRNMVLGFRPEQLNFAKADGETELNVMLKQKVLNDSANDAAAVSPFIDPTDKSLAIDDRVRTYMEVNCAICHNPQGPVSFLDFGMKTMNEAQLVQDGYITPKDPAHSKIWKKFSASYSEHRMPPTSLYHDPVGLNLFKIWIEDWK